MDGPTSLPVARKPAVRRAPMSTRSLLHWGRSRKGVPTRRLRAGLGDEEHFARGLSSFELAVGFARLLQAKGRPDAELQGAGGNSLEDVTGTREELLARPGVVGEGRAGQEEGPFLAQHVHVNGRDRPARLSEQDQCPPGHQTVQALFERCLADRVVDYSPPPAVREPLYLSLEILIGVADRPLGTRFERETSFLFGRYGPEHPRPGVPGHLTEKESDSPCRRMDQATISVLEGVRGPRKVVRGHALQHRGRGRPRVRTGREGDEGLRGDEGGFRVCAG